VSEPEDAPTYTKEVQRLRSACEHFLNLLDNPKPIQAWRRSVVDAWEEIQDAASAHVREETVEPGSDTDGS
jgi:hypothetical protein